MVIRRERWAEGRARSRFASVSALAVALAVGCIDPGSFPCESDQNCVLDGIAGSCVGGYCAFPDPGCESGLRFHRYAPDDRARQCVPDDATTTTSTTTTSSSTTTDGGSSGSSTTSTTTGPVPNGCALALGAGASHTCAVRIDGAVYCWGNNADSTLGDPDLPSGPIPQPVNLAGGIAAARIASARHVCVSEDPGQVQCWGLNANRQADPTSTTDPIPNPVPVVLSDAGGLLGVNRGHSCARTDALTIECWGQNEFGELGAAVGSGAGPHVVPNPAAILAGTSAISVGDSHSCVLANERVACWGQGNKLGLGAMTSDSEVPLEVPAGGPASAIAAGIAHTCAVVDTGPSIRVRCWGTNTDGQLGDGTTTTRPDPTNCNLAPSIAANVVALSGRSGSMAALTSDGEVWGWGANGGGKFGAAAEPVVDPVRVAAVDLIPGMVVGITQATNYLCARTDADRVWCWGSGSGAGDPPDSDTPVEIDLDCP